MPDMLAIMEANGFDAELMLANGLDAAPDPDPEPELEPPEEPPFMAALIADRLMGFIMLAMLIIGLEPIDMPPKPNGDIPMDPMPPMDPIEPMEPMPGKPIPLPPPIMLFKTGFKTSS